MTFLRYHIDAENTKGKNWNGSDIGASISSTQACIVLILLLVRRNIPLNSDVKTDDVIDMQFLRKSWHRLLESEESKGPVSCSVRRKRTSLIVIAASFSYDLHSRSRSWNSYRPKCTHSRRTRVLARLARDSVIWI